MNVLRRTRCRHRQSVPPETSDAVAPSRSCSPSRRTVAGLAPDPATTPEPVVQVYGARCAGLRGLFGIHTWVAVKPRGASSFAAYEVIGRRARSRAAVLCVWKRTPDTPWWGNAPWLLADRRGDGVDTLINRIDGAAREYPYADEYVVWPGPNSNTFMAHIARAIPELDLDLPPTAIGKDYLGNKVCGTAPSGHGAQVSLLGVLGALASRVEGFEINARSLARHRPVLSGLATTAPRPPRTRSLASAALGQARARTSRPNLAAVSC